MSSVKRGAGRRWRRFASVLTAGSVLLVLAGLAFVGTATREGVRLASQKAVRVAELRGAISRIDAEMVADAQLAASSGEERWVAAFNDAAPKLDAALAEANEIASPDIRRELAETAGEAHGDLLSMERRALELMADGDQAGARALLGSAEFNYLQEVWASGLDVFGTQLRTLADARAADLDTRAWVEGGALCLVAVLGVAMGLMVRTKAKLQAAMAHTALIAGTDLLTGLPNRRGFCQELEDALSQGRDGAVAHALLLIDLDRFKPVNDAHGHAAGDELLRLVGSRLRAVQHGDRWVARLGGDEFAVLLRCDPASADPGLNPAGVARRIVEALSEPFTLPNGAVVQVGSSVGIGLSRGGDDVSDLMHRADVGLYRAKNEGRNCFRFFEQNTDARVRELALLESEFRAAVAAEAIVPHFQPLVDLLTARVVGVEMLARWPHPERGMVSPAEFIPVAEASGLIGPMTVSLMRQGCRAAMHWPAHVTLACNISALQLCGPGLPATIAGILAETGFPSGRLEIEVTESAFVGNIDVARGLLEEIKALGVKLALDDFGTGYSSLRHLQQLPFDKLKIDQSFVKAMEADRESSKIVSAVVGLGQSLGMTTVAEGVESGRSADTLRSLGCMVGQGWFFGRPVPAREIDALWSEPARPEPLLAPAA